VFPSLCRLVSGDCDSIRRRSAGANTRPIQPSTCLTCRSLPVVRSNWPSRRMRLCSTRNASKHDERVARRTNLMSPLTKSAIRQQLEEARRRRRIPRATYRVQFNAGFTFRDAERLVPYLHALGISDLYASPILLATPGSTHGYDVCDPGKLNPELGTEEDFLRLVETLRRHDMGW